MANNYLDTRGKTTIPIPFTQAVINGLAPSGGLYVPQNIPKCSEQEIVQLARISYNECAAAVYKTFDINLPEQQIQELMAASYGARFDNPDICPIHSLDANTHILELWHGPTSAFKDMALQCLPHFFSASAKVCKQQGECNNSYLILVATSGDTGKAALEGFRDIDGIRIGVLYPQGGVSDIQYLQMATQAGNNVQVWAVNGNFDDCQTSVKQVFNDTSFTNTLMKKHKVALSSANSINWGRLLPQIVYYIRAYGKLVIEGKVELGLPIDVCVPTGNFGNILAAWYAKQMGTPIDMLFCASNTNCVLTDFINTGTYDISSRDFILTPSPSMDILVSSNLERQLFELSGRNSDCITTWMQQLATQKKFQIDKDLFTLIRKTFSAYSVDSATCLKTIKRVFRQHNYLIDPHTAVAFEAAENLRGNNPILIASTAHWAKFGANVYKALHDIAPHTELPSNMQNKSGFDLNKIISEETGSIIPRSLANLEASPVRFTEVINKGAKSTEQAVNDFLQLC